MQEAGKTAAETGLARVREILFGEILVELERRLAKLESYITTRSSDVEHGSRQRTDVLEAHLKQEISALLARQERLEAQTARLERENREQFLAASKTLFEELAQLRSQWHIAVARDEEELESNEGTEHASGAAH